jgi:hypothetical protein
MVPRYDAAMTGGEIVAGAKAAGLVAGAASKAKEALDPDTDIKDELARQASQSPHFAAAADVRAQRALVSQTIQLKLVGLVGRVFGLGADWFKNSFAEELSIKLENVPEDNLQAPKASIAVPLLENLSHVTEEEKLKELYLSLLAKAMDDRQGEDAVHPSFVHIISQLSATEARYLRIFLRVAGIAPLAVLTTTLPDSEDSDAYLLISGYLWGYIEPVDGLYYTIPDVSLAFTNWARLGLINIDMTRQVVRADAYDWVLQCDAYEKAVAKHGDKVAYQKGYWTVTDFGKRFARAIGVKLPDDEAQEEPGDSQMDPEG